VLFIEIIKTSSINASIIIRFFPKINVLFIKISSFSMFLIKGISLKYKKQFLIMAVGNCRSSSNFWVFISQACFIILKINLFYDTNESAKWKNNRAEDVESSFSMFFNQRYFIKI
jgi:hypothetical protein